MRAKPPRQAGDPPLKARTAPTSGKRGLATPVACAPGKPVPRTVTSIWWAPSHPDRRRPGGGAARWLVFTGT